MAEKEKKGPFAGLTSQGSLYNPTSNIHKATQEKKPLYNIPPEGVSDISEIQEDERGKFVVNIPEYRKGNASDSLRIPEGTLNRPWQGSGAMKVGDTLDETTYENLTGLSKLDETRELSKKGKKFHKKYQRKNK